MSKKKKKKSGNQDGSHVANVIILITAILNLIATIIDLVMKMI